MINDNQSLKGAKGRFDYVIPIYDDGFGPLFIHRDSMGITGIVRAQTWEDAYGICEDEFFPIPSDSLDDWRKEFGEDFTNNDCWNEQNGIRPNGMKEANNLFSVFYAKDMNGDSLDPLTPELCKELDITLEIEDNEE